MSKKRIGIFSGSFDPVHKGHVAFALQAADAAGLDKVYFAPEVKPRHKPHITHIAHRVAMLKLAVRSQPKLDVLELPERYFSAVTTMPKFKQTFPNAELVLLVGSDILERMHTWSHVEVMLRDVNVVVGARGLYEVSRSIEHINNLPSSPRGFTVLDSIERDLSSSQIRQDIAKHKKASGLLPSIEKYIARHWLYADVAKAQKQEPRK